MIYISNDEMMQLPEEPDQKFIEIERIVRERYEAACKKVYPADSTVPLMRQYMSIVLQAAHNCNITDLADWKRPSSYDESHGIYENFIADVDFATMGLRLRNVDRMKKGSVALDAAAKVKLRHMLGPVRELVDRLEVEPARRDRLYVRIADLENEFNRERTRLDAVGALFVEACAYGGEGIKKLEPLLQAIERIGKAIGVAKVREDSQARLPAPQEHKRIEPPKSTSRMVASGKAPPPPGDANLDDLDEEIPF